jgi:hypothetical protein
VNRFGSPSLLGHLTDRRASTVANNSGPSTSYRSVLARRALGLPSRNSRSLLTTDHKYPVSSPPGDARTSDLLTMGSGPDPDFQYLYPEHSGADHVTFAANRWPRHLPVRVKFISRNFYSRSSGLRGRICRWHLRLNEGFAGAFADWSIPFSPGEDVLFKEFKNPFCVLGRNPGTHSLFFFVFPVTQSPAWPEQGISTPAGRPRSIHSGDILASTCYLPLSFLGDPA